MILSLVRMRLTGFVRTGRALAPFLGVLVVIGVIYGGGPAQVGEAYGFSAVVLFPLIAWQTQILLNVEPDVQRRLCAVAVGGQRRELTAGVVAAAASALVLVLLALALPWSFGGVVGPAKPGDPSLAEGLTAGVWAHLILLPPALALGALASRAATANAARGVAVLVGGTVLAFVFGMRGSPVPWLGPPLVATSRSTTSGLETGAMAGYTAQAVLWTTVAMACYVLLRRRND